MAETNRAARIFDLSANHLCLDFINTLTDRSTGSPQELLTNYSALVSWSQQAHVVVDEEARRLLEEAARHSAEASSVLQRAITLREVMYRIFSTIAEGALPAETDLATFNKVLSEAMAHACVVIEGDGFTWSWTDSDSALNRILWSVVRSAADLLASQELQTVRMCSADDCNWLFLDTSKNRSRRWCDMKTCGNRAKVRRHYDRKKVL